MPCHPDNGIQFEKRQRDGGIVEIDLPFFDLLHQVGRQCININLESNSKCGFRAYSWPHSPEFRSFNRLMKLDGVAPECLVTEGIEAEDLLSRLHLVHCVLD